MYSAFYQSVYRESLLDQFLLWFFPLVSVVFRPSTDSCYHLFSGPSGFIVVEPVKQLAYADLYVYSQKRKFLFHECAARKSSSQTPIHLREVP